MKGNGTVSESDIGEQGARAPRKPRLSSARGRCSVDGAQWKPEHESSLPTYKGDGPENMGFK